MGVLAVAGGTGDVGRTIVDQLIISGKHKVVVLCRKVSAAPNPDGPECLAVNYDEIEETAKALQSYSVDTIISAVNADGPGHQAQLNLIAAAEKSSTVKRFIPSEYAGYALEKSGLKYTRFAIGVFMDYFGQPYIPSHLRPFKWALDIESRRAAIPGTGNEVLSMTYSKDVARFVDRLVDEDEWPEVSIVSGSDTTLNEMVAIAERVTGDKFNVTYDSLEELKAGKATVVSKSDGSYNGIDPVMIAAIVGTSLAEGKAMLPKDGRLAFPDIQPMSVEELITQAWSKN
ncbi:hypothetical protein BGZ61DRAFT_373790 [Ilyonectria robusta]|uniref:uncharacterized protein n=1 Tax=Ilyonectria robusta TaxID=1079257 RepID=UPI001E8E3974|nr:uncharacterized protein BGZ61DRAFT_373790 [Ilyonectria robusta]KAH8654236.1 hypothetical protein BGZ61DRAFT_373790 [Ilyonectria robusta]